MIDAERLDIPRHYSFVRLTRLDGSPVFIRIDAIDVVLPCDAPDVHPEAKATVWIDHGKAGAVQYVRETPRAVMLMMEGVVE